MDTNKAKTGRPSKLTDEAIEKALIYVSGGYQQDGDVIPTHAGIAATIKVHRATLYAWAKDEDNPFYDILEECNVAQERKLLNGGLSNEFNAAITKLALGKQGYSDKIEQDTYLSVDVSGYSDAQLDEVINSQD